MNLIKNKFFIVCVCIAVVMGAVPSVFALMGYRSLARNVVGTLTSPFRWTVTVVADAFEGLGKYFTSIDTLSERNEELELENAELLDRLQRAELLEQENARLRDYLGMKEKYPSFTLEEALIVSYASDNNTQSFTLNRGTMHGVEVNMPVIVTAGLVGSVTEVGLNWCTVTTILENESSVGAYIPRSGAVGIVSGDYEKMQDGLCKFTYVEADADVQVGDLLFTGGMGSMYPSELLIGEICEIEVDEYSRALIASVKPSVDLKELDWVVIITGYGD